MSQEWACPACTFQNPITSRQCEMCDTLKPSGLNMERIPEVDDEGLPDGPMNVPPLIDVDQIRLSEEEQKSAEDRPAPPGDTDVPTAETAPAGDQPPTAAGSGAAHDTEDDFSAAKMHLDGMRDYWAEATTVRFAVRVEPRGECTTCAAPPLLCVWLLPSGLHRSHIAPGATLQELHLAAQIVLGNRHRPECLKFAVDLLVPFYGAIMSKWQLASEHVKQCCEAFEMFAEFASWQLSQGNPACIKALVFLLDTSHVFFMQHSHFVRAVPVCWGTVVIGACCY